MANASGDFVDGQSGHAQASLYVLRTHAVSLVPYELFLDGSGARLTIAQGRTLTFDILVVGLSQGMEGASASAGFQIHGVIGRNWAGYTAFVGTPIVDRLGGTSDALSVYVEADDAHDALAIWAVNTGDPLIGDIRWVASVRTVEVGW
jgi:hypothetical protein